MSRPKFNSPMLRNSPARIRRRRTSSLLRSSRSSSRRSSRSRNSFSSFSKSSYSSYGSYGSSCSSISIDSTPPRRYSLIERLTNSNRLNGMISFINNVCAKLMTSKFKDKNKIIGNFFELDYVFKTRSVQGRAGVFRLKSLPFEESTNDNIPFPLPITHHGNDPYIIFKVSLDVDRTIEHENEVSKNVQFLPHFVRTYGIINFPVPQHFICDPKRSTNIFEHDEEMMLPSSVSIMEQLHHYPICKFILHARDKNLIMSQVIQVMIALHSAQQAENFTHYDLHTENVLVQRIDPNTIFLYEINSDLFLAVPTFGYYPVIIDMGLSYCKSLENKPFRANLNSTHYGFHTPFFDPLADVHHFLLSLLYDLEVSSEGFDWLCNKIKRIFKRLPVLRKTGWKKLPIDALSETKKYIKKDLPNYRKEQKLFYEFDRHILELINVLMILPLKKKVEDISFKESLPMWIKEMDKIIDIDVHTDLEVLFIIKEFIDGVASRKVLYLESLNDPKKLNRIISDYTMVVKQNITRTIQSFVNFDGVIFINIFKGIISFCDSLETIYFDLLEEHQRIIDNCYKNTPVKGPLDMALFINKHMPAHWNLSNSSIIYRWKLNDPIPQIVECKNISKDKIDLINCAPLNKRGNILNGIII